ncbi:MAG TPA: tetratricopeptide repeat protein [Thermoanaerobaculia bacterium]|nr:tetratricopeptide repeat protein [Thermoanaerobaculia bacterium]
MSSGSVGSSFRVMPAATSAVLALGLATAGAAGGAAAAAAMTRAVPKGMQIQSGSAAVYTTGITPAPPAAPAADPWSGLLLTTVDPFAPGAVPLRRRATGAPGAAPALAPLAPVPPLGKGEKPGSERVQALYRQALGHWAEGKSEVAFDELASLEAAVVNDKDTGSPKRLLRAEEKVIDQVAGADLEVLLPIARLHFEVFELYANQSAKGRALIANHSRTMVHDLAMLYREQSGSAGAALVASHLLTSLAELLQRGSQHQAAAAMYTQAAELDPHNLVPALRLAVTYEKFEQYKSAVGWLNKVLAIDPKHAEARLRLGINLGRLGKMEEAGKLLRELTAEDGDSWVTPVAYEELARLDERREAYAKAEEVLRAGMVRFPRTVRMRVELAALLDRQGKVREGRKVIEEIPALEVGTVEDGARFRYNNTTADSVASSRRFFEENAGSRMRVLAEVLARTAAEPAETAAAPPPAEASAVREQRP